MTLAPLVTVSLLNGLSYGLLLFMLSAGLTLIFSMMGVLNFAHASFYMLGAYLAQTLAGAVGFWAALLLAPLLVGVLGACFERVALRRVRRFGHVAELLLTFGLAIVLLELVQLVWGRAALPFAPPEVLRGPLFTLTSSPIDGTRWVWGAVPAAQCSSISGQALQTVCSPFPATRGFTMAIALLMLLLLWLLLSRTRVGLVIRSALTHPQMVEALGHDVPRVFTAVFGVGAALAALAGVVGGSSFVTEPAMAATLGSVVFVVVVVGGLGSLAGAFIASLLIGLAQTLLVALDMPIGRALDALGMASSPANAWSGITLAQLAPVLPFLLLVITLVIRPQGLLGRAGR